jgi:hypothetical protein
MHSFMYTISPLSGAAPHGVPGGELLCPMALYRVSGDIKANWQSIMGNVRKTLKYAFWAS